MKFGSYSIGVAQIDDENKGNLKIRFWPNSTINLLVSRSDMSDMRCISKGALKNKHAAILESIGTTEEILISLTRLPSITSSLLPSSLFCS